MFSGIIPQLYWRHAAGISLVKAQKENRLEVEEIQKIIGVAKAEGQLFKLDHVKEVKHLFYWPAAAFT